MNNHVSVVVITMIIILQWKTANKQYHDVFLCGYINSDIEDYISKWLTFLAPPIHSYHIRK